MKTEKTSQLAPTPIRLSEELKAWLRGKAVGNHRSLNGEVLARLEASRKADSRRQKGEAQAGESAQASVKTTTPSKEQRTSHDRG